MKYFKTLSVILLSLFVMIGCADDAEDDLNPQANKMQNQTTIMQGGQGDMNSQQTIAKKAQQNESFSTLVSALQSAGLVNMLSDTSGVSYTVFAPTNEAFNNLPKGTLDNLMNQENKQKLTGILQYHVVKGDIPASGGQGAQTVASVEGTDLKIGMEEQGNIMVNGIEVERTIQASNGVIYVIDEVLMPSKGNM